MLRLHKNFSVELLEDRLVASVTPVDLIIDDGQAGYSTVGLWNQYSAAGYLGDHAWKSPGNGSSSATWTFTVPSPGDYAVQATWVAWSDHATNATYRIYDGTTLLATVVVDQKPSPRADSAISGRPFQTLARVTTVGTTLTVVISDATNGNVVADAVRVTTPLPPPTPPVVPAYSSLPNAPATLYLDFDGHFQDIWGGFRNITTPIFDTDGDTSSYNTSEQAFIRTVWLRVSEDYSPFNINVTTVEPPSFADGVALRVAIGGDSSWYGKSVGGVSGLGSFTYSQTPNLSYVFPVNEGNNAQYTAEAVSHEAGHGFGLSHQSQWNGTTKVTDYYVGLPDGTGPIMGNGWQQSRALWWYGTTNWYTAFQDDMAVIAGTRNGFGYRPDEYGNDMVSAFPVTGNFIKSGVITMMADQDWFKFTTSAGTVTFTVTVPVGYNDLDARLDLYDASGRLIASASPTNSFGATITATLAAGTYYAVVSSAGVSSASTPTNYGFNVGSYTLTGIVAAPPNPNIQIVDDGDVGFSATGTWTRFGSGYQSDDSWKTRGTGAGTATWAFTGLTSGSYDISAVWNAWSDHATDATYKVYDGTTLVGSFVVNQKVASAGIMIGGVGFQSLGTVTCTTGTLRVVLSDLANGNVVADAIRVNLVVVAP